MGGNTNISRWGASALLVLCACVYQAPSLTTQTPPSADDDDDTSGDRVSDDVAGDWIGDTLGDPDDGAGDAGAGDGMGDGADAGDPVVGDPGGDPGSGDPGGDSLGGDARGDPGSGDPGGDSLGGDPGGDPGTSSGDGDPGGDPGYGDGDGGVMPADADVINQPNVRINEIFTDADDWVELYNAGSGTAFLEGWTLTDDNITHTVTFDPGTAIPPGGFLLICETTTTLPGCSNARFSFGIGKDVDAVYLYDEIMDLVDAHWWSTYWGDGNVAGRFPDGTGEWFTLSPPTPGSANQQ